MTRPISLTAGDLYRSQQTRLQLAWAAGPTGSDRHIERPDARWAGMALVGYLNTVHSNRVQVVGIPEMDYLTGLDERHSISTINNIFTTERTAMIIVSDGQDVPDDLLAVADAADMPLMTSQLPAPELIHNLQYFLARELSPRATLHGVLLSVMGHGVMLTGESGIGKSELALGLVSRGHHLVADDSVMVRRTAPDVLEGYCHSRFRNFLEVRGLGIVNITKMFGETASRLSKQVELIVHLQRMDPERLNNMDRLQQEKVYREILSIKIPEVTIPVTPGRDLSILVEGAVRSQILAHRGYDAVDEFIIRQEEEISAKSDAETE